MFPLSESLRNLTRTTLATFYGQKPSWNDDVFVTGLSLDSRTVNPGEAFWCLAGDPLHYQQALQRGAVVCLVPPSLAGEPFTIPVPDVLEALIQLAQERRKNFRGRVWTVTGSAGKTTLKLWLHTLLTRFDPAFQSPLSYNNMLGVAYSLASLPCEAAYGLFESGTSSPGEIGPLSKLINPDVAVITLIGPAHLEFFGSLEAIAQEKRSIAQGLKPCGTLVLPRDDPLFHHLSLSNTQPRPRILTFGQHPQADVRLGEVHPRGNGYEVTFSYKNTHHTSTFNTAEPAWLLNAAAVLASGLALGLSPENLTPYLGDFSKPSGRGKSWNLRGITLIDETYNANPTSFSLALESLLNRGCTGRRIAVVGDMEQLGPQALAFHASLNSLLRRCHQIYAYGPLFTLSTAPLLESVPITYAPDLLSLTNLLLKNLAPGDCVMVKGSRARQLDQVIKTLRQRLSS